jgi:hypothetical protein
MRAFIVVTAWDLCRGCHSSCLVINYKRQVHESVRVELKVSNGAEGAFDARPPACIPSIRAELNMCDDAEGAFDAGPSACIPNNFM